MKEEGPKLTIIPEQRYYTCWSCKYYRYDMLQSGLNPVYESTCIKMNTSGTELTDDQIKRNVSPFVIVSKTPSECPYLKSVKLDDRLKDLFN